MFGFLNVKCEVSVSCFVRSFFLRVEEEQPSCNERWIAITDIRESLEHHWYAIKRVNQNWEWEVGSVFYQLCYLDYLSFFQESSRTHPLTMRKSMFIHYIQIRSTAWNMNPGECEMTDFNLIWIEREALGRMD